MIQDAVDPFEEQGQNRASSGRVTIADRPIEAGVYSWGWVDYGDYGSDGRPSAISVVMFSDPTDRKSMGIIRRALTRPRWLSMLFCYAPVVLGYLAMNFGNLEKNGWLIHISLILAAVSGWQVWSHSRKLRKLEGATELWGDRNLESYAAGRDFLRALSHPGLARDDLFAYFDLRAHADELKKLISDTSY